MLHVDYLKVCLYTFLAVLIVATCIGAYFLWNIEFPVESIQTHFEQNADTTTRAQEGQPHGQSSEDNVQIPSVEEVRAQLDAVLVSEKDTSEVLTPTTEELNFENSTQSR